MLDNSTSSFAAQAFNLALEAPLTWSVPPLAAAIVLLLLRPSGRAVPYLAQLFLGAGAALSVSALFQLTPPLVGAVLATLAVGALLLDELLVQVPGLLNLLSHPRPTGRGVQPSGPAKR